MENKTTYFSHGKILISGEYLVMDGASAFTVPTWRGQSMDVIETLGKGDIFWQSKNSENELNQQIVSDASGGTGV